MPVSLHLVTTILLQILGFVAGFLLFVQGYRCTDLLPPQISMLLFAASGLFIPKLLFRFVIPAKCPGCGQAAFPVGSHPIVYRCRSCGQEYRTGVSEG